MVGSIEYIVLGIAALGLGVWTWLRHRSADADTMPPKWRRVVQTRVLEGITPSRAPGSVSRSPSGPKAFSAGRWRTGHRQRTHRCLWAGGGGGHLSERRQRHGHRAGCALLRRPGPPPGH